MTGRRSTVALVSLILSGCGMSLQDEAAVVHAELDSLGVRIVEAHRARDPGAFAALHTESVVFEWRGGSTSRGRAEFEAQMRRNWATRNELDLQLHRPIRRVAGEFATEVNAYRETWRSHPDTLTSEHGRYVVLIARQPDRRWLIEHWIGFTDSVTHAYLPRR